MPVMFEAGARPYPPRPVYRSYLAQSQVFVGIYWQSYGHVAAGEQVIHAWFGRAAAGVSEGLRGAGGHVRDRRQPDVRQHGDSVGVDGRDDADADNPEATGHRTDAT